MKMNTNKGGDNFNWDELLERIESGNIIPVIGQGLYWIDVDGKERLLYDYLAERLAESNGFTLPPGANHKFSKAAFRFIEKQKEKEVSDFVAAKHLRNSLLEMLKPLKLIDANPLWKLARVRAFTLFLNTTYDDFLVNTIRRARSYPTTARYYTLKDKDIHDLGDELFDSPGHPKRTLVYNLYGNVRERVDSAFTEKDILETIVKFQKDMEVNRANRLFLELEGNSLLFIGCGYEDWLFRFFVRTICNRPFQYQKELAACKFIGDDFGDEETASANELVRFLKSYGAEIFYSGGGRNFVKLLFDKLEHHFPGEIIPVSEFPATAFICFHGANRPAAVELTRGLKAGGVNVWLDEREFAPGDEIDETIINAIERCPVFVPLISEETKTLFLENGKMKYHYQEWNWVYLFNKKYGNKAKTIIPVIVDGTDWMYEKFKDFFYLKVPGGKTGEKDFEKLRKKIEEEQRNWAAE